MSLVHRPGVKSLALSDLRKGRGLHVHELADRAGKSRSLLTRWETEQEPTWESLLELAVGVMQYDAEEVVGLVYGLSRAMDLLPRVPASPIAVTEEELRDIRRVTGPLGRAATDSQEDLLIRALRAKKVREARKEAEALCETLLGAEVQMRRIYVEGSKAYQTWEVAERLCVKSVEMSGRSALEVAKLAYRAAELMVGEEAWRARVLGFCLAFVANGRLLARELKKSEEIFLRALELWDRGEAGDPERILPEWRLFDLEASLRCAQQRFAEAVKLYEETRNTAPREAWCRILVKKASALDLMLEAEEVIRALQEAAPLLEESSARLRFRAGCLMAVNLCHLGRYRDAHNELRATRGAAIELRDEQALAHVQSLSGRVAAGLGEVEAP